ncbi:ATPases involved in chromosome partitioning [invertebrate metagenome]|uniref:ATPases involved in chromosome partitioning n=1 Tax=invertebrate metagenome TaxID=1711999 RepID=A0A484H5S1_9ZZZZ
MTQGAYIIVVGNEKGGTGKSTIAMHVMVNLMNKGLRVGSIDLDARQATLTRYVENRRLFITQQHLTLPMPVHESVVASDPYATGMALEEDLQCLDDCVNRLRASCNIIVIDTPGSDHYLSRLGHTYADTLLTPLNDSLIDLDVLARVNPKTMRVSGPSHYAEMVWQIRKQRAIDDGESIAWVVTRNRLSQISTRNKRDIDHLLAELARRVGFRLVSGLSERVIYREMFLRGLTLLDLREGGVGVALNMSHVAARQELRALVDALSLPLLVDSTDKTSSNCNSQKNTPLKS